MKQLLLTALFATFIVLSAFAQKKVTIKAGTKVPLQSISQINAADVEEGQSVDFRVSNDVLVDGVVAISKGTVVNGTVTEAKKSSIAGTKGRLKISISSMFLPNGETIAFSNSNVSLSGKNRTPLAVITGIFVWPCIFISGSKAAMPEGYEVQATVASSCELTL